ncbi:serine hydrolase domain-containing protein [Nonomuraea antimicrobica]
MHQGLTALCAHLLAARGDLDLDAPVVRYWPEYGARGKDATLVRHLLAHQAGQPALREPLPPDAFYDWKLMATTLAEQKPFWAITNARGLAGMYRPLSLGGDGLVSREHLALMSQTASAGPDAVLLAPTHFALAFAYTMNKQGSGLGVNPRGRALVDAAYRALGHRQAYGESGTPPTAEHEIP